MMASLFDDPPQPVERIAIDDGAWLLRGWAQATQAQWLAAVQQVLAAQPFRSSLTPGGRPLSVRMSNCGDWGWVTDRAGYRYSATNPDTGLPWPAMPAFLRQQAVDAALAAGYPAYAPDACLVNQYLPGARMGLHRDEDEEDWQAPIVSVSLGLPCTFLWGGLERSQPVRRLTLLHGDVLVWGGATRMAYHGVQPLQAGQHALLGAQRWNLTFRMARSTWASPGAVALTPP
ncbi:MAG: DNA oxidative demethylase AlkB [Acidovorax sp.]|jgi:alkylated DNA repair protein (DNA oxidative demethylase)|nr:DNA oxidative demethylase AlkB [Acidovorax sp.]